MRAANQQELTPIIEEWLTHFASTDEVLERLEQFRVPSAPVLSPVDAIHHPYFRARGTVRDIVDPVLGQFSIPGFPLHFSAQPELPDLVAPLLGEHNQQVLGEMLGYDASQVAALTAKGVLLQGDR